MKFVEIVKTAANVGGNIFLGTPVFNTAKGTKEDPIVPAATSNKIVAAIAQVEAIAQAVPNMTKEQKLAAAIELATPAIIKSSALSGGEVDDLERLKIGIAKVVDGWNDIIKSYKKK